MAKERLLKRARIEQDMRYWVRIHRQMQERNLHQVVQTAKETQKFYEDTQRNRQLEASENADKELPPVFNKRLFVTQGAVIITREARRIMARNSRCPPEEDPILSKSELQTMRSVVEGLQLIHKGQDYVKDVLSRCVTIETYNPFKYVVKKPWENSLSCYYLVHGAVEVTYDMGVASDTASRNVYQPNIIYSHGTGEYLGIVSAEGRDEDIAPPATVYTKELCEFIRIDRQRFHRIAEREQNVLYHEIEDYLRTGSSVLSSIADDVKTKILHLIYKQEFPPNRTIMQQDEESDYLYVIVSGRCACYRNVYIPESDKTVLFYLCCREKDEIFGEECLLDNTGSTCEIRTSTHTVVYKLHRTALKIVNYDKLTRVLEENRNEFTSDEELRDRGYLNTLWNNYKHSKVKEPLKEHGKLKYMYTRQETPVIERPPTPDEEQKENMYRFVLKGSHFNPVRAQSARLYEVLKARSAKCYQSRSPPLSGRSKDDTESLISDEESETECDLHDRRNSRLLSTDMAQKLEELYEKGNKEKVFQLLKQHKDSKDMNQMLRLFDGNSELGQHIKKAWESQGQEGKGKEGFMKNGVIATMESDEIVRKAMAMADKQSFQQRRRNANDEEEWNTILHAENKQAKFLIAANKMRIAVLRKKLDNIEKQRNFNIIKRKEAKQRQNALRQKENIGQTEKENPTKYAPKKAFLLERLKNEKHLTLEELDSKTSSLVTSGLFLHKLSEKTRRKTMDDSVVNSQDREPLERKKMKALRPSSAILTKAEMDSFAERNKGKGTPPAEIAILPT